MDELQQYISEFTDIVRDAPAASCADLCFFKVVLRGAPSAPALARLIRERLPNGYKVSLFDGQEHNYLELGAWLDSQELALRLMGMGALLEMWKLLTPKTVLGDIATPELVDNMAGAGMLSIIAPRGSMTGLQ